MATPRFRISPLLHVCRRIYLHWYILNVSITIRVSEPMCATTKERRWEKSNLQDWIAHANYLPRGEIPHGEQDMLLSLDVMHSECSGWSCALMWSQREEGLALHWSSSNGFLLDSLPKGLQALCLCPLCLLFCKSLGCRTLIMADKWKTRPASNGVICLPALTPKWQEKKCTLCSTEFHYSAANLLELKPPWLAALHLQAPACGCKYVCVCVYASACVYVHMHAWVCQVGYLYMFVLAMWMQAQVYACLYVSMCLYVDEYVSMHLLYVSVYKYPLCSPSV